MIRLLYHWVKENWLSALFWTLLMLLLALGAFSQWLLDWRQRESVEEIRLRLEQMEKERKQ
jgi:hypothetical protein